MKHTATKPHKVVIVGGGFGGLYAAKSLANQSDVEVTLIDKRNFHLFQPLLYQVATGTLSPADIASPLRVVLSGSNNTEVLLDRVSDINPEAQTVKLSDKELEYDSLIIATGVSHHYFGNEHWQDNAPGLKTVEDALKMRQKIYAAFEEAEKEPDPAIRQAWLTFVVVGGGPTGVELAGAIAEIAHNSLRGDFRNIDPSSARILLVEGMDRILPPYPADLSAKAAKSLNQLGVEIQTDSLVTNIEDHTATVKHKNGQTEQVEARTILWAAGVKASGLGKILGDRTGVELDRVGRVIVEPDFSIPNYENIYVIGDLSHFAHQGDKPLPGVAPVAMQGGSYVAKVIKNKLKNQTMTPFKYSDVGSMAVIGQNVAVAEIAGIKLSGFVAWLIWVFAHIYYLIEFDNKLVVMIQWAWNYITHGRGARLITGAGNLGQAKTEYIESNPQLEKVEVKV